MNLRSGNQVIQSALSIAAGPTVLIQVTIASAAVVGFFAAASQPFTWSSLGEAVLCAVAAVSLLVVNPKTK